MALDEKDKALVRLYMAACFHRWNLLPGGSPSRLALRMHVYSHLLHFPGVIAAVALFSAALLYLTFVARRPLINQGEVDCNFCFVLVHSYTFSIFNVHQNALLAQLIFRPHALIQLSPWQALSSVCYDISEHIALNFETNKA